jgi:hypothetical protein
MCFTREPASGLASMTMRGFVGHGTRSLSGIDFLSQLLLKRLQSSDSFENLPACFKCILMRQRPDTAGADTEQLCIGSGLRSTLQYVVDHMLLLRQLKLWAEGLRVIGRRQCVLTT